MKPWLLAFLVACGSNTMGAIPDAPPPAVDAANLGARTHTLYLNFEGATLAAGSDDDATQNISSVVTAPTTFDKYLGSAIDRATEISTIVGEVQNILMPYDIDVTQTLPATGQFAMVITTDTASSTVGCPGCPAVAPADCGAVDSPISFNFGAGSGSAMPVHGVTADTVAMVGLTILGVPTSAVPDDCMCFSDSNCTFPPDRQCSIGGVGTVVSATKPGCPTSATVMDENALFLAGFGAHP
ncbi:MAG TPA: hypothetical protein VGG28_29730 [Kofleriaceae bacterium]